MLRRAIVVVLVFAVIVGLRATRLERVSEKRAVGAAHAILSGHGFKSDDLRTTVAYCTDGAAIVTVHSTPPRYVSVVIRDYDGAAVPTLVTDGTCGAPPVASN